MAEQFNKLLVFWHELKRRKVIRVLTAYAATSYIIIEVFNNISGPLHFPDWISTVAVVLLIAGLPIITILSWIFDVTPEGITKTKLNERDITVRVPARSNKKLLRMSNLIIVTLLIAVVILAYPKVFKRNSLENLISSGKKISVAIFPFQNLTNDPSWDIWQDGIKDQLITALSNVDMLPIRKIAAVNPVMQNGGPIAYSKLSSSITRTSFRKPDADLLISGNIMKMDSGVRITAQMINSKSNDVFGSVIVEGSLQKKNIFQLIDSLTVKIENSLIISKIGKEITPDFRRILLTGSPEAYSYSVYGTKAFAMGDFQTSVDMFLKSVAIDSNFTWAISALSYAYSNLGDYDQSKKWCLNAYRQRKRMPMEMRAIVDINYAFIFGKPLERRDALIRELEFDGDQPVFHWMLGLVYNNDLQQTDKAVEEFNKSLEIYKEWGSKPFWVGNYTELGKAYHKSGRFGKEKRLYKKAEKDFPDDPELSAAQAVLSFTKGDTLSGNNYISKYVSARRLKSVPEEEIRTSLANIFLNAGNMGEAEKYFRKAVSLNPANPGKIYELAQFLILNKRNIDEGIKLSDQVLAVNPADVGFLVIKGWGLHLLGRDREALPILEKSKELNTDDWPEQNLYIQEVKRAVAGINNN
jgi:tetratricopeptide (TPR) repeat protein